MHLRALALLAFIAVSAVGSSEALAGSIQEDPSITGGVELDPVTVEAGRRRQLVDEQVSAFVYSVVGSGRVESLARWNVPVCVATVGLTAAEADFVKQRISEIAGEAGVPLGRLGCGPNFVVIVTTDPEKLLKEWWSENPRLFNRQRGVRGPLRFIETDRPVRVWHNTCNAPPGISEDAFSVGEHCNTGKLGSRITRAVVRAIYTAIVVVDLDQIEGKTFGQVADYVAMVGLAQIHHDPEPGDIPTILALFGAGGFDGPIGLTEWDRSFLAAVYGTADGSVTEISQIKLRMGNELAR